MARKETVVIPYSNFKEKVLIKLKKLGYVKDYVVEGKEKREIIIDLAYKGNEPVLTDVKLFSKPGQRWYVSYRDLKPVMNNFGHAILSTPQGIMTNSEAKKLKIGGELLFNIW